MSEMPFKAFAGLSSTMDIQVADPVVNSVKGFEALVTRKRKVPRHA